MDGCYPYICGMKTVDTTTEKITDNVANNLMCIDITLCYVLCNIMLLRLTMWPEDTTKEIIRS